jgi:hypothetical protein
MPTGSRCRHPVNSLKRTECFAANNREDLGNLARDSSHPSHMAEIGYPLTALRWIPHTLTRQLKRTRVIMRLQLFPRLPAHAHNNWHYPVARDESWSWFDRVSHTTCSNEESPE